MSRPATTFGCAAAGAASEARAKAGRRRAGTRAFMRLASEECAREIVGGRRESANRATRRRSSRSVRIAGGASRRRAHSLRLRLAIESDLDVLRRSGEGFETLRPFPRHARVETALRFE